MDDTKLILAGLSDLDEEELREAVGQEHVDFKRSSAPMGALPEPSTITAIVTLTPIGLAALAAYLSKGRRRKRVRERQRILHADGRVEEREFDLDESSEDALKAGILKQLGTWIIRRSPGTEAS